MIRLTCAWPAPELWQNKRVHFMKRYLATESAKREARLLSLSAGAIHIRGHEKYKMTVIFRPSRRSRADEHNLPATVKAHIDGIAQAMCINDKRILMPWYEVAEKGGPGAVEFIVEPMEAEQ